MSKECQSCVKEGIGCKEIQYLLTEVNKLKVTKITNTILYASIIIIFLGFIAICAILWYNMLRQPIATTHIGTKNFKDLTDLFNSQFSNLLTTLGILLSVFGVVIPIAMAIYQRLTLNDERESFRREMSVNIANIEAKEKELEQKIDFIVREREKQNEDQIELKSTINGAKQDLQQQQNRLDEKLSKYDKKLEEQERRRALANGYFMQQLAMSASPIGNAVIYYCNALPYMAKYCDDDNTQRRFGGILDELIKSIKKMPSKQLLVDGYFDGISAKIKAARKELPDKHKFALKLDEIKDLLEKKIAVKDAPAAHPVKANTADDK